MTTDAIFEEHGSDWLHQVSAVGTAQWLQHDQTLPSLQRVWLARLLNTHPHMHTVSEKQQTEDG